MIATCAPRSFVYWCYGLQIVSRIPLAELSGLGEMDSSFSVRALPDTEVAIRLAPIQSETKPPAAGLRFHRISDRESLLEQKGVGRFLVRNGREIVVDPDPDVSPRDLRLYLLGSVLGTLLHQRRFLPLHANAIAVDRHVVAFVGDSGAGKSTLAAHFQRAGYDVLADDICVVSFDDGMQPLVWPGLPRIKLWHDTLCAFGRDAGSLEEVTADAGKFYLPPTAQTAVHPRPLRAVYVLASAPRGGEGSIQRLRGRAAFQAMSANIYRREPLRAMGLTRQAFDLTAALLRHTAVYRATRPWGFDVFDAEAARLEQHFRCAS
jgi:hypothetical protein